MVKVAIIGAGSIVFTKQFLNDMFNTPCMAGSTYSLMGPALAIDNRFGKLAQ